MVPGGDRGEGAQWYTAQPLKLQFPLDLHNNLVNISFHVMSEQNVYNSLLLHKNQGLEVGNPPIYRNLPQQLMILWSLGEVWKI